MLNRKIQADKFFDKIFNNLMKIEGGYVNDPDDSGGETYKGISRVYNPNWDGWKIIDSYKNEISDIKNLNKALNKDKNLQKQVKNFYKQYYYKNNLKRVYEIGVKFDKENTENIVSKLFDFAVNTGIPNTAIRYLQEALNYLNRNQKDFDDLIVDGIYGPKTEKAFLTIAKQGLLDILYTVLQCIQCRKYLQLMEKNPNYEKFRGWFRRVKK